MKKNVMTHYSLVDYFEEQEYFSKIKTDNINNKIKDESIVLDSFCIERFKKYTLNDYCYDIENDGIKKTWNNICKYAIDYGENKEFLNVSNFGEMYEIALAIVDKQQKKENGQYYTPEDVAVVMSEWFDSINANNICDVACGTGKLILTYLDYIGRDRTLDILKEGRLYLYDLDEIALKICKTSILLKYGIEYKDFIHDIQCDFLNKEIRLPENCKVISNPPYANVANFPDSWDKTNILLDTKELYSAFMEKIMLQSQSSVIITPYSFIGGKKFYSLRSLMNNYSGFIVSFDNVPGNIFCGRKHGIFNTNTSNSVRAAITVVNNSIKNKGFRISPLIRFKNEERLQLLNCKTLEQIVSPKYQIVSKSNPEFAKCHKELQEIFDAWTLKSSSTLGANTTIAATTNILYVPNTCRYFTTASSYKLNRKGMITLKFTDNLTFDFVYCLINSSFAYWWWRIFDGGITYPLGLLNRIPMFNNLFNVDDKEFFSKICNEMLNIEKKCMVTKLNAGKLQENIKFPPEYRNIINKRLLNILGFKNTNPDIFNIVHKNSFGENIVDGE